MHLNRKSQQMRNKKLKVKHLRLVDPLLTVPVELVVAAALAASLASAGSPIRVAGAINVRFPQLSNGAMRFLATNGLSRANLASKLSLSNSVAPSLVLVPLACLLDLFYGRNIRTSGDERQSPLSSLLLLVSQGNQLFYSSLQTLSFFIIESHS